MAAALLKKKKKSKSVTTCFLNCLPASSLTDALPVHSHLFFNSHHKQLMCGFKNFDLRAGHVLRLTNCFEHGQRGQETKKKCCFASPPIPHLPYPFLPPNSCSPSTPLCLSRVLFTAQKSFWIRAELAQSSDATSATLASSTEEGGTETERATRRG